MNEKAGQGARREVIMKKSGIFTIIKRESRPDLCVRADESVF